MSTYVKLSKRLHTIANFLSEGTFFIDVGSDHGYLPCYVCQKDPNAKAIASEVREGPFLRTKETVHQYNLTDRIDVRLGDGLSVLTDQDNISEIVIAGMGGTLITEILQVGKDKLIHIDKIIAQPNNHAERVRKFFLENGFHLVDEVILEENDHIYEILVAKKNGSSSYREDETIEKQLYFGPILMKEKSIPFQKKWQFEKEKYEKILKQIEHKQGNEDKIRSFKQKLRWIEEVLT